MGDYKTTQEAYVAKLGGSGGWADYEVKGAPERKRAAEFAGYKQQQAKITAATADYVAGTFTIVLRTKDAAADSDVLKSAAWLKAYATLSTTALYQQIGEGACMAAGGAALSSPGTEKGSAQAPKACKQKCEDETCTFYTHDSSGPKCNTWKDAVAIGAVYAAASGPATATCWARIVGGAAAPSNYLVYVKEDTVTANTALATSTLATTNSAQAVMLA